MMLGGNWSVLETRAQKQHQRWDGVEIEDNLLYCVCVLLKVGWKSLGTLGCRRESEFWSKVDGRAPCLHILLV